MFYDSVEIDEDLKCSFCREKFEDVVKLIPDCGESICGRCYEEIRETSPLGVFRCQACLESHTMPRSGLPSCKGLARILTRRRIEKPLSEQARTLRPLLETLESRLGALGSFRGRDHVDHFCDQLETEVAEAIASLVRQINELEADLLQQVRAYRQSCIESLSAARPGTSGFLEARIRQEIDALTGQVEAFAGRWRDYFGRVEAMASESEIWNANEAARGFLARAESLERRLRANSFGGKVMIFRADHPFVEDPGLLKRMLSLSVHVNRPELRIQTEPARALSGHTDWIKQVIFLSDGRLASCSNDATIRLWSLDSDEAGVLCGHTRDVDALALLPNGCLASGSLDKTIKIWDLESGSSARRTLSGHTGAVLALRALKSGRLASYSTDDTVRVWDPLAPATRSGLLLTIAGHGNVDWTLSFGVLSDDRLVTCSVDGALVEDCVLRVWSPSEGGRLCQAVSTGATAAVSLLVLANDLVAVGFNQGAIRLVDLADERRSRLREKAHWCSVTALGQLANGCLVSCDWDSSTTATIKLWSVPELGLLQTLATGHSDAISSLAVSGDEAVLASASYDATIKLWPIRFDSLQPSSSSISA